MSSTLLGHSLRVGIFQTQEQQRPQLKEGTSALCHLQSLDTTEPPLLSRPLVNHQTPNLPLLCLYVPKEVGVEALQRNTRPEEKVRLV